MWRIVVHINNPLRELCQSFLGDVRKPKRGPSGAKAGTVRLTQPEPADLGPDNRPRCFARLRRSGTDRRLAPSPRAGRASKAHRSGRGTSGRARPSVPGRSRSHRRSLDHMVNVELAPPPRAARVSAGSGRNNPFPIAVELGQ